MFRLPFLSILTLTFSLSLQAAEAIRPAEKPDESSIESLAPIVGDETLGDTDPTETVDLALDSVFTPDFRARYGNPTIYDLPYSRSLSMPDWKRLWINTAVLVGAGVTTMVILESLPADATAWNKHENAKVSMWKRWVNNVKKGPVWDRDNLTFNLILHPYAGAAYYMGARSNGFNFWGSFLYSFCISSFFWEYGFESFNEIPSVQDLLLTPVVGSLLGEGFYLIKRHIVSHDYRLWGWRPLGYIVAFLVDPINECIGYFRGTQRHQRHRTEALRNLSGSSWLAPSRGSISLGLSMTYAF